MHGVVVEPFSAPDEAVPLEDFHDRVRDQVPGAGRAPVTRFACGAAQFVSPVMRDGDIDVDRDAKGVRAEAVRARDRGASNSRRRDCRRRDGGLSGGMTARGRPRAACLQLRSPASPGLSFPPCGPARGRPRAVLRRPSVVLRTCARRKARSGCGRDHRPGRWAARSRRPDRDCVSCAARSGCSSCSAGERDSG
jgi:hypothetical protein